MSTARQAIRRDILEFAQREYDDVFENVAHWSDSDPLLSQENLNYKHRSELIRLMWVTGWYVEQLRETSFPLR